MPKTRGLLNSAPSKVSEPGDPADQERGGRDGVHARCRAVHNGRAVQVNVVPVDGNRAVLLRRVQDRMTSDGSDIVSGIRRCGQSSSPRCRMKLDIKTIGDQSVFVPRLDRWP